MGLAQADLFEPRDVACHWEIGVGVCVSPLEPAVGVLSWVGHQYRCKNGERAESQVR